MKILYVTTVGATMGFFKDLIRQLLDLGHTVDVACNDELWAVPDCYREWGCHIYQIDCSRSPLSMSNLRAIRQMRTVVQDNKYDVVHCHTPVAAICARAACRKLRKKGKVKVVYTAHGFHFFKGAPKKNWLMFYPVEWLCAHWTDVLVTINREDYALANRRMHSSKVEYVPGVGIDIAKFASTEVDRKLKRAELGVPENAFLLLSVGELNVNKNQEIVLQAMAKLKNERIHYAVAGKGELAAYLIETAERLGLKEQFHLLGFRSDVAQLYKTADAFVHPSLREGLPVAVMEAIASHLPALCSDIRGARDLVDKKLLFAPRSVDSVAELVNEAATGAYFGQEGNFENLKQFDISNVIEKMTQIYKELLDS